MIGLAAVGLASIFLLAGLGLRETLGLASPGPVPLTLPVLRLMPESAEVACAIPPVADVRDRFLALAKRFHPEDDLNSAYDEFVAEIAETLEADTAATLEDLLAAKGIDAFQPLAMFADTDALEVAAADAEESAPESEGLHRIPPGLALVIGCADIHVAQTTLESLIPAEVAHYTDESYNGVFIRTYGDAFCSYYFDEDRMVIGNSLEFVKDIAKRRTDPAKVRYGSADCPAGAADELVALVRMDRAAGRLADVTESLAGDESHAFLEELLTLQDGFSSDPLVVTLGEHDDAFELLARADLAQHEGLRTTLGKPSPLRLAQLLPEDTLGFMSLRFNQESRALLVKAFANNFPETEGDEAFQFMTATMFSDWMTIIDDEMTIAVTEIRDDEVEGIGMLAVNNKDQLSTLVSAIPGETVETHRNVDLRKLPFDEAGGIHYAIARNVFVMSTDIEQLRGVVDRLLDRETSALFASFTPPIDEDTPRYGALVLRSDLLAKAGIDFLDSDDANTGVGGIVRDARLTGDVEGTWLATRLAVYLTPPASAQAD